MTLPAITPDSPYVYLAILGVIHFVGAGQIMNAIRGTGYNLRTKSGLSLIGSLMGTGYRGFIGVVILFLPLVFGYLLLNAVFFLIEIAIIIFSIVVFAILLPLTEGKINWDTLLVLALSSLFVITGLALMGGALRNGASLEDILRNLALMGLGGFLLYLQLRKLAGHEE